jgi:TolB protein
MRYCLHAPTTGVITLIAIAGLYVFTFAACTEKAVGPEDEPEENILFLSTRDGALDHLGRPLQNIYRMNKDGTGLENLTGQPSRYIHLSLSPDGRRIAFASDCNIRVMNTDGTNPVRLTNLNESFEDGCNGLPRWSPVGTRIAFASNRENRSQGNYSGLYDVYVMNADGSGVRTLTTHSGDDWLPWLGGFTDTRFEYSPWSPDGTRIAFKRLADVPEWGTIYVINANGSGLRRLTDQSSTFNGWSPGGTRIAFTRWTAGTAPVDIYVINADGSGLTNLTDSPSEESNAVWLPH